MTKRRNAWIIGILIGVMFFLYSPNFGSSTTLHKAGRCAHTRCVKRHHRDWQLNESKNLLRTYSIRYV
jgi:hypothetical protein